MRTTGEHKPVLIFDGTLANETKYSDIQPLNHCFGYSIQIIYTGSSLAGTHLLETSLNGVDWVQVTGSSVAFVAGGSDFVYSVTDVMYPMVRVNLTSSNANTVTSKIYSVVKGV